MATATCAIARQVPAFHPCGAASRACAVRRVGPSGAGSRRCRAISGHGREGYNHKPRIRAGRLPPPITPLAQGSGLLLCLGHLLSIRLRSLNRQAGTRDTKDRRRSENAPPYKRHCREWLSPSLTCGRFGGPAKPPCHTLTPRLRTADEPVRMLSYVRGRSGLLSYRRRVRRRR